MITSKVGEFVNNVPDYWTTGLGCKVEALEVGMA